MDCKNSMNSHDMTNSKMSSCMMLKETQVPGMAYVPWQRWGELYRPDKALHCGTLFAVLDKPFRGGCR